MIDFDAAHPPVAPSIPEEPKSPISIEKAASQKEGGETCEVCGRPKAALHEWFAALTGPHPAPSTLCPRPSDNTAADLECYRLGYERQRAEVEKLKAAHVEAIRAMRAAELAERARADAAEAEVLRLTKERDTAQQVATGATAQFYSAEECARNHAARADAAVAECARLTKEVQEARAASEQSRFLAADKQEELNAALADAKALREALPDIENALLAARIGTYDLGRLTVVGGERERHNAALDLAVAKVRVLKTKPDRAIAPPNPSPEKLTPTVAPLNWCVKHECPREVCGKYQHPESGSDPE